MISADDLNPMLGRPGKGTRTAPPKAPVSLRVNPGRWMGKDGMELHWEAGDNDASYFEVEKDGAFYTKISIGHFCFDEEGTSQSTYRIRAVDMDAMPLLG